MIGRSSRATPPRTPLLISEQIERWLDDCRARGLAPGTVNRSYSQATRQVLLPFCAARAITTTAELTRDLLAELATELHGRAISKWTVAHYLRTINQFLSWLGDGERAPLPRLKKVHRDVLTLSEMRELETHAPDIRDQLIIRLLSDTGAREGEIANLRLGDAVERGGGFYVLLRGKTGERMAPTSPEVHHRLKGYSSRQRPRTASNRLFLSRRRSRKTRDYEPLTESGIYQVVKDTAVRAGWQRRIYPHLLRMSAITRMVSKGMHPALISEIVGVSVEVISKHYSHPTNRDRYDAMMRALVED